MTVQPSGSTGTSRNGTVMPGADRLEVRLLRGPPLEERAELLGRRLVEPVGVLLRPEDTRGERVEPGARPLDLDVDADARAGRRPR